MSRVLSPLVQPTNWVKMGRVLSSWSHRRSWITLTLGYRVPNRASNREDDSYQGSCPFSSIFFRFLFLRLHYVRNCNNVPMCPLKNWCIDVVVAKSPMSGLQKNCLKAVYRIWRIFLLPCFCVAYNTTHTERAISLSILLAISCCV